MRQQETYKTHKLGKITASIALAHARKRSARLNTEVNLPGSKVNCRGLEGDVCVQ